MILPLTPSIKKNHQKKMQKISSFLLLQGFFRLNPLHRVFFLFLQLFFRRTLISICSPALLVVCIFLSEYSSDSKTILNVFVSLFLPLLQKEGQSTCHCTAGTGTAGECKSSDCNSVLCWELLSCCSISLSVFLANNATYPVMVFLFTSNAITGIFPGPFRMLFFSCSSRSASLRASRKRRRNINRN